MCIYIYVCLIYIYNINRDTSWQIPGSLQFRNIRATASLARASGTIPVGPGPKISRLEAVQKWWFNGDLMVI